MFTFSKVYHFSMTFTHRVDTRSNAHLFARDVINLFDSIKTSQSFTRGALKWAEYYSDPVTFFTSYKACNRLKKKINGVNLSMELVN